VQDAQLRSMASILLSSTPALFRPVPPRFVEIRGGGAHVGHKTSPGTMPDVGT